MGSVSGAQTDKSAAFSYRAGAEGTPIIDMAPVSMECCVEDNYETEGFDNFICRIAHTYADESVLDSTGRLDYTRLKPVLFDFPTYSYIATSEVIGKCLSLDKSHGMCAKLPLAADGIVRLSRIEVYPQYRVQYMAMAAEVGEVSLRTEPGVLTMYALCDKADPCQITIMETYASQTAYLAHVASAHPLAQGCYIVQVSRGCKTCVQKRLVR